MGKFKAIRHDIEIEGTIGHRLITMEMALQGFEIEDLTRTPD